MRGSVIKAIVSILVVGCGIGYLLWSTAGSAVEYYKNVDELSTLGKQWRDRRISLHGFVEPGSIQRRLDRGSQRMEYRFVEVNCGKKIPVHYTGTGAVPDTFKDSAEVVAKGRLVGDSFESDEILAKCPSKYQAKATAQPMCSSGKAQ